MSALHHPWNAYISSDVKDWDDEIQDEMFKTVQRWWSNKSPDQQDTLRHHLLNSTIANGENKQLIHHPSDWGNKQMFGQKPPGEEDKSFVDTLIENVNRIPDIPQALVKEFVGVVQLMPSADIPNPVDTAISLLPVTVPANELSRMWR